MRFSYDDALRVGDILAHAVDAQIMPRSRRLAGEQVREQASAFDVVTDADEAAEQAIASALTRLFPQALLFGEEAAAKDPDSLAKIATADLAFIIDPIDGTKNFVAGPPLFGVMAAATPRGEIALGAIHDPVCGDTAFALRRRLDAGGRPAARRTESGGGGGAIEDGRHYRNELSARAPPIDRQRKSVASRYEFLAAMRCS
jgi:fructose-1,6-bisphosphatase/inositol monophosphatase family enzyme